MADYQAGDAQAFEALMVRHEHQVWVFVKRFIRDGETAEDLLQEVFMRMVRGAADWKSDAKVSTWIYTIARNLCSDHARGAVYRQAASLEGPVRPLEGDDSGPVLADRIASHLMGGENDALNRELRVSIDRAVEALPVEQREVFLMHEVMDMTFDEIARAVGASGPTVRSRMRYALEKLRDTLETFYERRTASAEGGA